MILVQYMKVVQNCFVSKLMMLIIRIVAPTDEKSECTTVLKLSEIKSVSGKLAIYSGNN
jgi:hypothetical protein